MEFLLNLLEASGIEPLAALMLVVLLVFLSLVGNWGLSLPTR